MWGQKLGRTNAGGSVSGRLRGNSIEIAQKVIQCFIIFLVFTSSILLANNQISYESSPPSPLLQASLSSSVYRTLNREGYFFWGLGAWVTYRIGKKTFLGVDSRFTHGFTKYKESRQNFSFEDTKVFLRSTEVARLTPWELELRFEGGLLLPSSKTSQRAGMRGGIYADASLAKEWRFLTASFGTSVYGFNHKFKTKDEAGTEPNSYFAFSNYVDTTIPLVSRVQWNNHLEIYHYANYAGNFHSIYRILTGPRVEMMKGLVASATFHMKDRTITNNSFFDDETKILVLGLNYQF